MITIKIIPITFLSVGIFLLMQVIMPIVSFQLWMIGQKYNTSVLVSPLASRGQVLGVSLDNKDNFSAIVSTLTRQSKANYSNFEITIPRLNVDKATVLVDSNDLSGSLAQLPGSALPGEKGNLFISGHSALSRLFSLKNAVFSNLQSLKIGDEIKVDVLGVEYKYQVAELKVVDPNDLSVVYPPDLQGRYISLMTCVPPGLNFKRLIVLGKMI